MGKAKRKQGKRAGGGSPKGDRRPASSPGRKGPGRPTGRKYTPEERRTLLEAFAKSGMKVTAFCATVGVAPQTLGGWKRRYEAEGPKGLEPRTLGRPRGTGMGSRLARPVKEAILATKRRFPTFGLRKVKDYLGRFRGLRVSAGGVKKVLEEAPPEALPPPPKKKRRRAPKHRAVRRFERSRPGELWQSDITSYLLARHHRRVYLVAFLDDFSRYIVSWSLATQAKGTMVTECLLDGVQRFGKPREVLTDQGPQYYTWRGKSAFRKLLDKEGIRHVVARTHHPQTVGKCERLWKTIRDEFWDRAHPEELEEARERMGHWVRFYNHFRPHQGLDGLVPADRFFGASGEVRKALEARMDRNELQLALGEKPRRGVFMAGQVGDRAFSMHGERGGVVFQTEEGLHEAMGLEELGMPQEGGSDERKRDDDQDAEGPADATADAHPDAPAGGGGAGAVGAGDGGGEAAGLRGGHGDPRVVAGGDAEGGGARAAGGEAAAPVADVADGAERDAGGTPEAAEEEGEGAPGHSGGGEPGGAEEEDPAARAGPPVGPGAGRAAPDAARLEEGWPEDGLSSRSGSGSERCSEGASAPRGEGCSPRSTA